MFILKAKRPIEEKELDVIKETLKEIGDQAIIFPDYTEVENTNAFVVVTKEEFLKDMFKDTPVTKENKEEIIKAWNNIRGKHNFILKLSDGKYYSVEHIDQIFE